MLEIWDPSTLHFGRNTNRFGQPQFDDEKMDAYELGWRTRPSDKLLIELSLYHYTQRMQYFRVLRNTYK